ELARGDAAMQINAVGAVVLLFAANDKLIVLDAHIQIVLGEARDCQRYSQAMLAGLLNVVRGITFRRSLVDPIEHALDVIKAEQQRTGENRNASHRYPLLRSENVPCLPIGSADHAKSWLPLKGAASLILVFLPLSSRSIR